MAGLSRNIPVNVRRCLCTQRARPRRIHTRNLYSGGRVRLPLVFSEMQKKKVVPCKEFASDTCVLADSVLDYARIYP